jgi:hypothetical protein
MPLAMIGVLDLVMAASRNGIVSLPLHKSVKQLARLVRASQIFKLGNMSFTVTQRVSAQATECRVRLADTLTRRVTKLHSFKK